LPQPLIRMRKLSVSESVAESWLEQTRVTEVFSISRIERRAATSATRQPLIFQTNVFPSTVRNTRKSSKDIHNRASSTSESFVLFLRHKGYYPAQSGLRFAMEYLDKGCGRSSAELVLYEVSPSGARPPTSGSSLGARPLSGGSLFCGYRPDPRGVPLLWHPALSRLCREPRLPASFRLP